jgi:hypothetical protein
MTNAYIITGTLTDAKTVQLDEPLPMSAGRVRVIVEPAILAAKKPPLGQVMEKIWAEQAAQGQIPPTEGDVEARIREERDWGDR